MYVYIYIYKSCKYLFNYQYIVQTSKLCIEAENPLKNPKQWVFSDHHMSPLSRHNFFNQNQK